MKEKQIPYELVFIDVMNGAHKTPEYKKNLQPFGQIPVMDDDGFKLYGKSDQPLPNILILFHVYLATESRAIGRYIATKYADSGTPNLIPDPKDFEAFGLFERACSLEYCQFNPAAEGLCNELVFRKSVIQYY